MKREIKREINTGANPMTSKEEFVRMMSNKAQEKDVAAEPYIPADNPAEIEEISKQLKKEFAEKKGKY